ncbi:hypothetical protein ES705_17296 [subsurface metagenome]
MSKKLFCLTAFVLLLGLALTSAVEAADIAFYVGQWNADGWYGAEQFDHVDTIIAQTGHLFKDIQQFDDAQLDAFGAWVDQNTDDGEMDIIWLNGCTPSCLYQFPNVNPDGSRAELWLDGGNMIINVADWFAYCSWEGGTRQADNTGTGAANILDLDAGIIASADGSQAIVTPTGKEYLPSLGDAVTSDRPVIFAAVQAPWEVAAIFASGGGTEDPAVESGGDPVVLHNTETNGYIAFINQASGGKWLDDRGLTCAEFIGNWVRNVIGLSEPALAAAPNPEDEAVDVLRDVVLGWTPGEFAAPTNGHKVYFGESFDDVNDAAGAVAQSAAGYAPTHRLDFGKTYYWRVDEVNAPPTSHIEFKGDVWSFTTEPVAYAIDGNNITATASSSYLADTGPENTINGSGLDVNDMHSTVETDMWLSDSEPNGAWIEYELDKVYKLHEMWVWNVNQMMESYIGFGLKDVTIDYSTNGTDYTTLGTWHEFAQGTGTSDYAHNTTVDFGSATAKYIRLTANSNWGGLMPRYGLSEVRFFSIPVWAREPSPDSEATDVSIGTIDEPVDVTLSFRAGREAARHDVYFSPDEQSVIDGNAPVTTVTEASYGPLSLDLGTTYYWRIDEVNEAETPTTWQGDICNFTTQEYFVVDDFEDYNDYPPNEIWSTWIDGYGIPANGATAGYPNPDWNLDEHYVETAIVHGGQQAMPYFYDNSGPANYSEATFTLSSQFDWTMKGADVLSLRFRGRPEGFVEGPAGNYTMTAAGYDIWGTADEFRYACKQLSGDGEIVAQVLSVEDTDQWAKAGVMIRETLDADSKFAALYMTADNGCRFQARLTTGVDAVSDSDVTTLADVNTPHWVKLERVGNEFNAYDSNDGFTWTPLAWNPQTISMGANVYIGLALTSHNSGVTCSAEFSDVQTTVSGPFTQQAIGIDMPTNDPAQMYVALASSGGTPAIVFHDDLGATQANTWTEWTIDLQEFAAQGVNLTNVNTFSIGFGDKNNLQPGGSGVVFFDDIRLYRSTEPEPEPEP